MIYRSSCLFPTIRSTHNTRVGDHTALTDGSSRTVLFLDHPRGIILAFANDAVLSIFRNLDALCLAARQRIFYGAIYIYGF